MKALVEQYRELVKCISSIDSQITLVEYEIAKLEHEYCPEGVKGIDYTTPRVQTSYNPRSVVDVASDITYKKRELSWLQGEREKLVEQQVNCDQTIKELGDVKTEIVMMKIKGMTNAKIAEAMCYSQRQIERITASMRRSV